MPNCSPALAALRQRIARLEAPSAGAVPFGLPAIDAHLPQGGLARGGLHELAGGGAQAEHGAAATLLLAGLLGRICGPVLWVLGQPDLFAPALANVGLAPERVIQVAAGGNTLLVMEEGLRQRGLAAVVGELSGPLSLVAGRRLQLAAETTGGLALLLRRSPRHADPALAAASAALTRWRVFAISTPVTPAPGLGRARWRLELTRGRGVRPAAWIVEACDAQGGLGLVAALGDGSLAAGAGDAPSSGRGRQ